MARHDQVYLLAAVGFTMIVHASAYCHKNDTDPYRLFASKTSYDVIRARAKDTDPAGCQPIQVYFITRHGARYDSKEDMELMHKLLPVWRDRIYNSTSGGKLCEGDRNLLKGWEPRLNTSRFKQLSETGKKEQYEIAERFVERYRALLDRPYDNHTFWFRSTNFERTISSATAFAKGFFNRTGMDPKDLDRLVKNINMVIPPLSEDWVLKFYDLCEKFIKEVDDLDAPEQTKFLKGKHYDELKASVSKRLGVPVNTTTLKMFYDMCRFEYAIYHDASPWCAVFTKANFETVEHGEDIKYYWKKGYGHKINYEMTCKLIEDIQTALKAGKDTGKPSGVFRFSHNQLMLALYARLDLFKPEQPPRADNFPPPQNRPWWDSKIGSFSANLVFVLYKCGTEYKIKAFSQEKPITLPFCNNQELCPYLTFMKKIDPIVKSCDIQKICKYVPPTSPPTTPPNSSKTLQCSLTTLLAMTLLMFACK